MRKAWNNIAQTYNNNNNNKFALSPISNYSEDCIN